MSITRYHFNKYHGLSLLRRGSVFKNNKFTDVLILLHMITHLPGRYLMYCLNRLTSWIYYCISSD